MINWTAVIITAIICVAVVSCVAIDKRWAAWETMCIRRGFPQNDKKNCSGFVGSIRGSKASCTAPTAQPENAHNATCVNSTFVFLQSGQRTIWAAARSRRCGKTSVMASDMTECATDRHAAKISFIGCVKNFMNYWTRGWNKQKHDWWKEW